MKQLLLQILGVMIVRLLWDLVRFYRSSRSCRAMQDAPSLAPRGR